MHTRLLLLLTLLVVGCRSQPVKLTPTAAVTAVPPAALPIQTPVPAAATKTANQLFMPFSTSSQPVDTAVPSPQPFPPTPTATAEPVYPIYTGPAIDREDFGIQIHIHREDLDEILDQLQTLAVGWVKVQVSWKLYQPHPDAYAEDRFAELDALVEKANGNDIAVLLSVSKAPEWSRPTTDLDGPPTSFTLYRDFMATLAGRYPGRVAAYELWNEPNLKREWNGRPLDAADLVDLIREGAAGVRSVDPKAVLISGAPATTGINDGLTAIDDRVFLRQMLAAGVTDFVDAIGAHPYGWANPPDSSLSNPDTAVSSHNNHPSFFFADTLADYTALIAEFGAAGKPIWVTEFGWGSFDGFNQPPPVGVEYMAEVTEWQQAVYLLRAYELAHEWDTVGPMILWNLNFGPLLGNQFSESGYSLLRPDSSLRPAYRALVHLPKE